MEELIKKLEDPFNKLGDGGIQERCEEIAKELFCDYGIKCGDAIFRFAEIEFYYYEKGEWDKDWNTVTYARDGYKGGDLFFHLSGVDICFDSTLEPEENENRSVVGKSDNRKSKFGGILIRSVKDEKKHTIIAGPLNCKDAFLNACKGLCMPQLIQTTKIEMEPAQTKRCLGKDDQKMEDALTLNLCFYDDKIKKAEWNVERKRFCTKEGKYKKYKPSYKLNRFDLSE